MTPVLVAAAKNTKNAMGLKEHLIDFIRKKDIIKK